MNISNVLPGCFGGSGMRVLMRATLGIACLAPLPALAQRDMGCSPTVANPCTGGSRGSSSSGGGGTLWDLFRDSAPSAAEQARTQRRNEALAANHEAIEFQKKGDWARAVALFQEAAKKDPGDPIIRQNLANAQQGLAKAQEEQAQLRIQAQEKASAERMSKSIQDLAQSFNAAPASAAPASGGLDFDGRNAAVAPAGSSSASAAGGGLDFTATVAMAAPVRPAVPSPSTDPRVVDARNVRSGLSPAVDKAIDGVFASASPGVSDRVRKGFQAAMAGDWKVAEAWFADALNRDPGNIALKNMLAAARSSTAPARTAQRVSPPRDEVGDLYSKGYEAVANGDRAGALVALEAAIDRDPKPSGAAITFVAYLRASAAAAKNQTLQLPQDSDIQFLFPGPVSSAPAPVRAPGQAGAAAPKGQELQLPQDSEMALAFGPVSPAPVPGRTPAQAGARPASAPPTTPILKRLLDAMTGPEKPAGSSNPVAAVRG